ncbi:MAG TPA: FAD-dependent monooxygenase, partial [bacterium]|nr:FAD-dependent monooxygenase [bacterium]
MTQNVTTDVVVFGAGPSGASAAALLNRLGHQVLVLERQNFPRFSIGESMLPQVMGLLEESGLLRPIVEAGFQYKNGAAFERGGRRTEFDFRQKSSQGWGSTYQVQRAV